MKFDKFVLAIIVTIIIAYFFPQFGAEDSVLPLNLIASVGISLIFFFYGLKLSKEKIKSGLSNWKLHLLIQLSTFALFPLLIIAFYPYSTTNDHIHTIWLGFLFLGALPSTVSSSVVMVSMAKGNMPAAIFNASISGIIGILITPLWIGLFVHQTNHDFDYSAIYIKLLLEIAAPLTLGILLQKFGHQLAIKYAKELSLFDKSIILIIIYKSFAESFIENIFSSLEWKDLGIILVMVLILFLVVYLLIARISRFLKFSQEDTITAQFCGTKKSLVHGTVFSKILFQGTTSIGIILLPLMIFHAVQILIISLIATKLAKREDVLG
ncbi:bile acid:sodium symporter family protein [Moheibacter sediminis]|uniref:Solute carrier family 10 (Sodium/bile acid cotransporter), member 7 n=1 Tax=Moheibacter sediminis TaxID=1434700 RepID=A0A1W2BCK0_9FLAO|nr:bile acid:sodium symporter family protein [Moheibacter sediminis]SMC70442.1 solute carrier family 10 (sodium/bile acid cotransporter), member 7 [Moheibacter sediminis]